MPRRPDDTQFPRNAFAGACDPRRGLGDWDHRPRRLRAGGIPVGTVTARRGGPTIGCLPPVGEHMGNIAEPNCAPLR